MTSIHMPPASDPASVESFLRGRDGQPSYPGPRKRAIRAAQERRYDADRLLHDLASVRRSAEDPRVLASRLADGDDERAELRRMGWTDERYDRVVNEVQEDLRRRVHPPTNSSVTAGAGVSATRSRPSSHPNLERPGTAGQHIAAARALGYDPVRLWPSLRGLVASAAPTAPVQPDQAPVDRRSPQLPATSPLRPIRSSAGRSEAPRDRGSLDARRTEAERAIAANRANPRSGKNAPSRAADRGRPVVRPRGERRTS
jgi:hypothetical protein